MKLAVVYGSVSVGETPKREWWNDEGNAAIQSQEATQRKLLRAREGNAKNSGRWIGM